MADPSSDVPAAPSHHDFSWFFDCPAPKPGDIQLQARDRPPLADALPPPPSREELEEYDGTLEKGITFKGVKLCGSPPASYLEEQDRDLIEVIWNKGLWVPPTEALIDRFLEPFYPYQREVLRPYYLKMHESMGFDVPDISPDCRLPFHVVHHVDLSNPDDKWRADFCFHVAVQHLGAITGNEYKPLDLQKATRYFLWPDFFADRAFDLFFLTFSAENPPELPQIFQAAVLFRQDFRFGDPEISASMSYIRVKLN